MRILFVAFLILASSTLNSQVLGFGVVEYDTYKRYDENSVVYYKTNAMYSAVSNTYTPVRSYYIEYKGVCVATIDSGYGVSKKAFREIFEVNNFIVVSYDKYIKVDRVGEIFYSALGTTKIEYYSEYRDKIHKIIREVTDGKF